MGRTLRVCLTQDHSATFVFSICSWLEVEIFSSFVSSFRIELASRVLKILNDMTLDFVITKFKGTLSIIQFVMLY